MYHLHKCSKRKSTVPHSRSKLNMSDTHQEMQMLSSLIFQNFAFKVFKNLKGALPKAKKFELSMHHGASLRFFPYNTARSLKRLLKSQEHLPPLTCRRKGPRAPERTGYDDLARDWKCRVDYSLATPIQAHALRKSFFASGCVIEESSGNGRFPKLFCCTVARFYAILSWNFWFPKHVSQNAFSSGVNGKIVPFIYRKR